MKLLHIFITSLISLMMMIAPVEAQEKPIEVIVFPGGFNWPLWVAQQKGFFAANQVSVNVTPTSSSVFQMTGLIDGRFDIAMTAVDNIVAYRSKQEDMGGKSNDLIAVMGSDRGFLRLVTVPEVASFQQLRGKTLSVDARDTGYAFVLYELLDRAGLREPDYSVEQAGGVLQRFQQLMEKKHAGTLLVSPFEVQAQAHGYHVLATASDSLGAYQGVVAGVHEAWARNNHLKLESFIRAYAEGVEWLYAAEHKDEALQIYMKAMPQATKELAETAYQIVLDPKTGLQRWAKFDETGLETVLKLRAKWSASNAGRDQNLRYYDPLYYEAAMGSRPAR